jgi:hypothetical protein
VRQFQARHQGEVGDAEDAVAGLAGDGDAAEGEAPDGGDEDAAPAI